MVQAYIENLREIHATREINGSVLNISGRQRMLSQRIALFCFRLVCSRDNIEQELCRSCLRETLDLMEISHHNLIYGNSSLNLPGITSDRIWQMYFEPPLRVDQKVCDYIGQVRKLIESTEGELTLENPQFCYILQVASHELLESLDYIVSQYEKESNAQLIALNQKQEELYKELTRTISVAQSQAQQLEKLIRDLKQSQLQVIQAEKMSGLGQLVAGVAHEINNPVNFIGCNLVFAREYVQNLLNLLQLYNQEYPFSTPKIQTEAEAMEVDFLIKDLPQILDSMQLGADRILNLVQTIKNFSRVDESEMKPVDLHEGLDTTLIILQHRLKGNRDRHGIQVIKNYGELPLIEGYGGQLNQVFMNLLSNAIDALENQAAPRIISISTDVKRQQSVVIRIADNGLGINPDIQSRIFEPFFTTKPVNKGTGLGLSISHQIIVENHGGLLRCNSELGNGTEFYLELPIQQHNLQPLTQTPVIPTIGIKTSV